MASRPRRAAPPPRRSGRRAPRGGRQRGKGGSDLGARVLVAIPAIAFAVFIVVEGGVIFALGLLALAIVCLHELYGMLEDVAPVRLAGILGAFGLLAAALWGDQFQVLLVAVAVFPLVFGLTLLAPRHGAGATLSIAVTLLGVYWIGLAFAHAVLLRALPHGGTIIIDLLIGTFIGDTGAYLGGRLFGRRPLAPRISPNKTVEGLAAGMVCAILAVWFAGTYSDWLSGADALILGLGVAIAAPVGDLFESLIKRDAGTKDTGTLFGAHGGALDRLDAVIFAIPVGYYIWSALA